MAHSVITSAFPVVQWQAGGPSQATSPLPTSSFSLPSNPLPPSYHEARCDAVNAHLNEVQNSNGTYITLRCPEVGAFEPLDFSQLIKVLRRLGVRLYTDPFWSLSIVLAFLLPNARL